jgi:hypothetical protein
MYLSSLLRTTKAMKSYVSWCSQQFPTRVMLWRVMTAMSMIPNYYFVVFQRLRTELSKYILRKCCQERIIDVPHYTRFPYPRFRISAVVFHYYDKHRRSVLGNNRRCVECPVNCAQFHDSSDHILSVAFHLYPTLDIWTLFLPQKHSKYLAV